MLTIVSLALAALPAAQDAASAVRWTVQAAPGARVEYTLTTERTLVIESNDRFETTTKSEQALAIELVTKNADDTSTLALHFGPAKGSVRFAGSVMKFDSERGIDEAKKYHAEHSGHSLLRVGKTMRIVVDARGRVQQVDGLAKLYEGSEFAKEETSTGAPLDDPWFVSEAQSWIALLPDVVPTRSADWTDSFPVRTFGGSRIEFRPQCNVKSASDTELAWTFKTASMGSPSSKSKALPRETKNGVTTIELKARAGREWLSKSPFVSAAAIEGSTSVSRADGLAVRRTVEWQAEVDLSDLQASGPKTKARETMRTELVRR